MIEQLINIRKIKISGYNKVSCHPIILASEWMTTLNTVLPKCTISQMTQYQFSHERDVLFLPIDIVIFFRIFLLGIDIKIIDLRENILWSFRFYGADTINIIGAGIYIKFYCCYPCTILPTIYHLVH